MAKRIVRYRHGGAAKWGLLEGPAPVGATDQVEVRSLDVEAATTSALIELLDRGAFGEAARVTLTANQLLSPVTADGKILCQGLNYASHAAEVQDAPRTSNLIFAKASSALTGAYAPIKRPVEVELLDYEVEFGVVLRRGIGEGERVTDQNIGEFVAAIVLCNDVSARDTMFGETFFQWYRGKSYRTFCPAGPVLWYLDPGEVAEALGSVELALWVNDDLRQSATSGQLIFKPAETLDYIGSTIDLVRGDLLLTGTPGGVTASATPKAAQILKEHLFADAVRRDALRAEMAQGRPFLQPGDVVRATMRDIRTGEQLGGLANPVAAA